MEVTFSKIRKVKKYQSHSSLRNFNVCMSYAASLITQSYIAVTSTTIQYFCILSEQAVALGFIQ